MKTYAKRLATLAAVGVLTLGAAACGGDEEEPAAAAATPAETQAPAETPAAAEQDIVALASGTPDLSTLVSAVGAAELVETLQGAGPFTVFAPTNEAFARRRPGDGRRAARAGGQGTAHRHPHLPRRAREGDGGRSPGRSGAETVQGGKLR